MFASGVCKIDNFIFPVKSFQSFKINIFVQKPSVAFQSQQFNIYILFSVIYNKIKPFFPHSCQ